MLNIIISELIKRSPDANGGHSGGLRNVIFILNVK